VPSINFSLDLGLEVVLWCNITTTILWCTWPEGIVEVALQDPFAIGY
jgi:hypothetical protein